MRKPLTRIKKAYLALFLAACITGGVFVSCKKSQPSWDTNILAPIIYGSLSINNLVTDTLVKANPDSSVNLVYDGTVYNLNTDTLVKMPDTTLIYDQGFLGVNDPPGQTIITTTPTNTTYNISTVELRKATLQSGHIKVNVQSQLDQPIDITFNIPIATLGSNPLSVTVVVPPGNNSVPGQVTQYFPLAGYKLDLSGPNHNSYNTITYSMSGKVDPSAPGNLVVGSTPSGVAINVSFDSVTPSYVRGYFGTTTKTFTGQADFPLFSRIVGGSLLLQNMSVNMTLSNYFGVDARVTLSELSSVNTRTNTTVPLNYPTLINNAINVNRATETFNPSPPVIPSVQTFSIPASSMLPWVDNLPNVVKYGVTVTTDPLGNVSGFNDFAYEGPGIESYLNISVPLSLIATNLTLEDTLNVNFASGGNQAQNIKSGTFTLYADNGFPFSAGLQVYLLDSLYRIKDSLMAGPQTIAAGIMNSNGIVTTPQTSVLVISLNTARMQLLLKTKHIIMLSRFNMGCASCLPPQYRKIYSYYQLNVKLVGNFDYQIKG